MSTPKKSAPTFLLALNDKVEWEVTGKGASYIIPGVVIGFIKRNARAWGKLPKDAVNQKLPKSGNLAAWRIHGRDINTLNDRYLVRADLNGEIHYFTPTTTKIHRQLNLNPTE